MTDSFFHLSFFKQRKMNSKIKISEKGFYSKGAKQLSVHKWKGVSWYKYFRGRLRHLGVLFVMQPEQNRDVRTLVSGL